MGVAESVVGFKPVYDGNAKILIMGTVPSVGGVKYNFFYMSKVNKFWYYLTKTLGTTDFVALANAYRAAYDKGCYNEELNAVKNALYSNGIALYDIIATCERVGSSDSQIISSQNNSSEKIFEIVKANPNLKMIFVNSYEVEKRLRACLKKEGVEKLKELMGVDYEPITRVLSPSPMCFRTHTEEEVLESWKQIKKYL